MLNMLKSLYSIMCKISTRPALRSQIWSGNKSLLSIALLNIIWLLRVFSGLQIFKLFYRTVKDRKNTPSIDKNSARINISPMFTELYYIIFFVSMLLFFLIKSEENTS